MQWICLCCANKDDLYFIKHSCMLVQPFLLGQSFSRTMSLLLDQRRNDIFAPFGMIHRVLNTYWSLSYSGIYRSGLHLEEGDMRFGLFRFSDFRKLVFLNHWNFGEISRNSHFFCIFNVKFCLIFLNVNFFLNEF